MHSADWAFYAKVGRFFPFKRFFQLKLLCKSDYQQIQSKKMHQIEAKMLDRF